MSKRRAEKGKERGLQKPGETWVHNASPQSQQETWFWARLAQRGRSTASTWMGLLTSVGLALVFPREFRLRRSIAVLDPGNS